MERSGLRDARSWITIATDTSIFLLRVTRNSISEPQHRPARRQIVSGKIMPVFCGPRGLPFGGARLYRNRGDGTFEDVSVKSKISQTTGFYAFTAIAADLTGDGWTDIYVACDSTPKSAVSQ